MTATTRHNRDNGKMADKAQKRRALTKFVQTVQIKNNSNMNTIINIYFYNVHPHGTVQFNQNIEKSSSGKSSFKSSICAMILHGPFSCSLILTVPLTVK